MVDPFGRTIRYLRVSVTDRCDLRCFYCMSEDMTFLPKADLLTLEELDRLCSAFIAKGVRKLRLTGGEPLVRRNVMSLVRSLSRHLSTGALDELTLTTNGSQLSRFANELADCGVRRINVSLDTLDADKFRAITRWGDIDKVIAGIEAARAAGLAVKINAVALKNLNEDEIPALMRWAHGKGMGLTLIEVMPMGDVGVIVARAARPTVHAERSRREHRRPGPLRSRGRDRRQARLHHADDAQLLRILQPGAHHLHRHAAHLPRARRCLRFAQAAARLARQ
jgi:cyclic pyranopterin phosphate synthase